MAQTYNFLSAVKQPTISPYKVAGGDALRFLDEFNGIADSEYKGNPNLKVLRAVDVQGIQNIAGSNYFVLPIAKRIVSPARRVGKPEDLQRTLNDGDTIGIRQNHFVDLGIVLDFSGLNHDLAVDLFEQMPTQLRDFDRLPAVVLGYGLKNSDKGNFGLGFVCSEGTEVRTAKILNQLSGRFSDKDVSLETGLPVRLSGGDRGFNISQQMTPSKDNLGLTGLYLDAGLDINANHEKLAVSGNGGLVVLF